MALERLHSWTEEWNLSPILLKNLIWDGSLKHYYQNHKTSRIQVEYFHDFRTGKIS